MDVDCPWFAQTVLGDMRARLARSARWKGISEVSLHAAHEARVVSAKRVLDPNLLYDALATQDMVTMIRSAIRQLFDGRELTDATMQTAALLATVLGQDLDESEGGRLRIARKVARDRVISTVDPDAHERHKTQARGFDGYKGHIAVDPDSEIITDTIVTAGYADGAADLIDDPLDDENRADDARVYGDSAYATGEFQQRLDDEPIDSGYRTQPPSAPADTTSGKDCFEINVINTVTCPAGVTVTIRRGADGGGIAFARGRTIQVGEFETALARACQPQTDRDRQADYRAN